jgi:hypothetical protein
MVVGLVVIFCLITHFLSLCRYCVNISAAACSAASAFAPAPLAQRNVALRATSYADEVDYLGNNLAVKNLLEQVESSGLLTKVAQSGLLSKAQEAGVSLSKLEPLLALIAKDKSILILVEAATPELIPILPKLVDVAPGALPLLAAAITIPPFIIQALGLGSLGAAFAIVQIVPDDTVLEVALQTAAVGVLGVAAPAASFIGAAILGKLVD